LEELFVRKYLSLAKSYLRPKKNTLAIKIANSLNILPALEEAKKI
jgi:hypothetical protein